MFSTDFPHLRPQRIYCNTVTDQDYVIVGHSTTLNFDPPWTHHVAFVLPPCCLQCLLPPAARCSTPVFGFFLVIFMRCFSSRARPVPCRIVQCLVTCVLVFMYLRTLVSCGFCCLIWDQIKSDWCWGNKWTGVFNNLWYAVTLNKNMETRCEYCFIISVLMSFDNEDCW